MNTFFKTFDMQSIINVKYMEVLFAESHAVIGRTLHNFLSDLHDVKSHPRVGNNIFASSEVSSGIEGEILSLRSVVDAGEYGRTRDALTEVSRVHSTFDTGNPEMQSPVVERLFSSFKAHFVSNPSQLRAFVAGLRSQVDQMQSLFPTCASRELLNYNICLWNNVISSLEGCLRKFEEISPALAPEGSLWDSNPTVVAEALRSFECVADAITRVENFCHDQLQCS
ncbi:MAG: hypothetical protein LBB16_00465 [Puniceicoccales bacterium]|jgi:hypothetical protein|nr:hypothetical protein [Puniceicoccales bacterium]